MKPTRRTQPYRKGSGMPGPAGMYAGRTAYGHNPMDLKRALKRKPKRRPPAGKLAMRLRARGR